MRSNDPFFSGDGLQASKRDEFFSPVSATKLNASQAAGPNSLSTISKSAEEAQIGTKSQCSRCGGSHDQESMSQTDGGTSPAAPAPTAAPTATGNVVANDNFSGRSSVRFGVGERLSLTSTMGTTGPLPSGAGLAWTKRSGLGTLTNSGLNDGNGSFVCGARSGAVVFDLVVVGSTMAGTVMDTKTISVVEPTTGTIRQKPSTGIWHVNNQASVGFKGEIFMGPNDVSFNQATFSEGAVAGTATGDLSMKNGENHSATGSWLPIGMGNSATGSKMLGQDTISTGQYPPPFPTGGTFHWPIPWQFKVGTEPGKTFTTAHHRESVDTAGMATIQKAGSGAFSKNLADPSSSY